MTLAVFLAPLALLLERFIGYPPALYAAIRHPVVWMGALIGLLDARLNQGKNRLGKGPGPTLVASHAKTARPSTMSGKLPMGRSAASCVLPGVTLSSGPCGSVVARLSAPLTKTAVLPSLESVASPAKKLPGVPSLDDRVNGMIEGLGGLDVKIVGRGATGCTEEQGINLAEDILTANPDLKSIYAACGPPAAGAAQAIRNANLAAKPILVGFDFCCGEAEALEAGIEDATVAQFPAKMASLGVEALVKAIRGEPVESLIDSGAALVTKSNMADFQ